MIWIAFPQPITKIQRIIIDPDGIKTEGPSFAVPDPAVLAKEAVQRDTEIKSWRHLVRTDLDAACNATDEIHP